MKLKWTVLVWTVCCLRGNDDIEQKERVLVRRPPGATLLPEKHFYDTSSLNHPKLLWVQWCLWIKWQTIFSLQCVGHSIKSTQADYLMMTLHQSLCTWQPVILALCHPAYQTTTNLSLSRNSNREKLSGESSHVSPVREFSNSGGSQERLVGVAGLPHSTEVVAGGARVDVPPSNHLSRREHRNLKVVIFLQKPLCSEPWTPRSGEPWPRGIVVSMYCVALLCCSGENSWFHQFIGDGSHCSGQVELSLDLKYLLTEWCSVSTLLSPIGLNDGLLKWVGVFF